ncbi:MAG: SUMF1/EgtB/PvdO family nonheme iron enzyme, partial [Opitutaceae bacterium]
MTVGSAAGVVCVGLLFLSVNVVGARAGGGEPGPMRQVELGNGEVLRFVWVPPGSFWRGSGRDEAGRGADEGPRHEVTLSRGFFLGVHEVTQARLRSVAKGCGVAAHHRLPLRLR